MVQGLLIDVVVVQPVITFERGFQVFQRVEPVCVQDVAYTAIKALDHAVRLRPIGRDQPMINAMLATELIDFMLVTGLPFTAGSKAISKCLAVIGEQRLDLEGRTLMDMA